MTNRPTADDADVQRRLAALRAALPHVETRYDAIVAWFIDRRDPIVLDAEWSRETLELTTIGLGDSAGVVSIDWTTLDDVQRNALRAAVELLVRRVPAVYHNACADLKIMRRHGFDVNPATHAEIDDTMLAHAVLHPEEAHTLEHLNAELRILPPYKDLAAVAPVEYNAADIFATWRAWALLQQEFARDPAAEYVYRELSVAYLRELQIEQEETGIRVAADVARDLLREYTARVRQADMLALASAGWPINLRSSPQMKTWLYAVEDLPVQHKWAPQGAARPVTVDKDAISALRQYCGTEWDPADSPSLESAREAIAAGGHPILEARYLGMSAQQAVSHYILPCFNADRSVRERIYPETRIHVQETGRHSYVKPALSQFSGPVLGLIAPDTGATWIGHDWNNVETWLLGVLADDAAILEAKAGGFDTHVLNYCDITGAPRPPIFTHAIHTAPCSCGLLGHIGARAEHAPTCPEGWRLLLKWRGDGDARRTLAKRFVYKLHYRGKPENAGGIPGAAALGFNRRRLIEASERYLAAHPALVVYWREVEECAKRYGVVYSFMGRPRRLTNKDPQARIREACNHPVQAGVADLYIETALLVKRAAPWARLVYGSFDSQWWSVAAEREDEFTALYQPIVQRTVTIHGRDASFPASFKRRVS